MPQTDWPSEVVAPGARVEKILSGFEFAEGPVFSRLGFLLFTDLPRSRILKHTPGGPLEIFRENSNRANGLTFDRQGRLLACEGGAGRLTRTEKNGVITVLADRFEGKLLNAPNDIVHAIDGSAYFTDLRPRNAAPDPARVDFSAVYHITRPGGLRLAARDLARPNGVALSANQQTLFVADSEGQNVRAYQIAPDGALTAGRVVAELKHDRPGGPDGLKTDENGNLFVAGHDGVWIFDSTGRRQGLIPVPEQPSNLAWGDDYRALYITARTSLYRIRMRFTGTRTF